MRGVIVGALLAALIAACAGHKAGAPQTMAMDPRKEEVQDLWMQIRDWRVANGMSADPGEPAPPSAVPKLRKCSVEREPTTEVCQDTCSLKDAICDNAERICDIAGELGNDPWANEKCKSGKASCQEATEKCCECTAREAATVPGAGRSTDNDVF